MKISHSSLPVLDENHQRIRALAIRFAQSKRSNNAITPSNEPSFTDEAAKELSKLGFFGVAVESSYGGAPVDAIAQVLIISEIAKVDAAVSARLVAHNASVCASIQRYGSQEQKQRYLPRLATGEILGAACFSEEKSALNVTENADHYVLNGTIKWVTNGSIASVYLVIASENVSGAARQMRAFLIDSSQENLEITAEKDTTIFRGADTGTLSFSDAVLSKNQVLCNKESRLFPITKYLDRGRIGIAAQAVGIATGGYDLAVLHAKTRKNFDKSLADHQAVQFKLADMATKIEAAHLLTLVAAGTDESDEKYGENAAIAKLYASETVQEVIEKALQIHVGYGYVRNAHLERLLRDARAIQIYGGASEIQRGAISKAILA